MSESALVADSQSTSGVTRLYESCGFRIVNRDTIYRKPLEIIPGSLTLPVHHYTAAGGVVVFEDKVLVLERPSHQEIRLPKGHIESSETPADAALREVQEESGYAQLHITADLGTRKVEFDHQGMHIIRTEYYFLMELGTDLRTSGEEEFEPKWLSWRTALEKLTYPAEKEWLRRASEHPKTKTRQT